MRKKSKTLAGGGGREWETETQNARNVAVIAAIYFCECRDLPEIQFAHLYNLESLSQRRITK